MKVILLIRHIPYSSSAKIAITSTNIGMWICGQLYKLFSKKKKPDYASTYTKTDVFVYSLNNLCTCVCAWYTWMHFLLLFSRQSIISNRAEYLTLSFFGLFENVLIFKVKKPHSKLKS